MYDHLLIKDGSEKIPIELSSIVYAEAASRYIKINLQNNEQYIIRGCISNLEDSLPPDEFCRIHRSYIVALKHVRTFTSKTVNLGKCDLPIGRQFRSRLDESVAFRFPRFILTKKDIAELFEC